MQGPAGGGQSVITEPVWANQGFSSYMDFIRLPSRIPHCADTSQIHCLKLLKVNLKLFTILPAVFASSPRLLELQCLTICRKFYALSEAVQRSAGPAIMAHHALDNSGCKRLRISSLVCDMSAENSVYALMASGSDLVDKLRTKGLDTTVENNAYTRD